MSRSSRLLALEIDVLAREYYVLFDAVDTENQGVLAVNQIERIDKILLSLAKNLENSKEFFEILELS